VKIKNNGPKKAIKIRIYPNIEQTVLLYKTFGCCRKLYNTFLDLKQKKLSCPTEHELKTEFPYMTEIDSIALQQSRINLKNAYDNFFKSRSGKRKGRLMGSPQFKSRKNGTQSYRSVNVSDNIKIDFESRHIKLPKIGWVKFRDDRVFSQKIRSVTVSRDPSHRFYVSILIDKIISTEKTQPEKVLGLDMSLQHLIVDSTGNKTDYPRYFRKNEDKLAWEQRKLSRKQKGSKEKKSSNSYQKQKIAVAKIHAKISDSRKDFLQKTSTQITNEYDVICIESLNMKGMAQSLNLGKSVGDVGWGQFSHMLEYKALWKGKTLIKVSKFFPSSKLCSVCGFKNKALTLSDRDWTCPRCGVAHDRDINASVNIRDEGIRVLNHSLIPSTVGTTETDLIRKDRVYAQEDCVRPVHKPSVAFSDALPCSGNGR